MRRRAEQDERKYVYRVILGVGSGMVLDFLASGVVVCMYVCMYGVEWSC